MKIISNLFQAMNPDERQQVEQQLAVFGTSFSPISNSLPVEQDYENHIKNIVSILKDTENPEICTFPPLNANRATQGAVCDIPEDVREEAAEQR